MTSSREPGASPPGVQLRACGSGAPGSWRSVKLAPRAREQFSGFTPLVLRLCGDNLVTDDRFAHTGPGWVLRELSRVEPDAVRDFVAAHPGLSAEARRMALARMQPARYRRR